MRILVNQFIALWNLIISKLRGTPAHHYQQGAFLHRNMIIESQIFKYCGFQEYLKILFILI